MNHICYIYIFKYYGIRNVGISLDARYWYVMDEEEKTLTIEKNDNYVEGFWPEGVSSLAAIVGNNGSGKSSCLLYMLHALARGSGEKDLKAIIIYKNNPNSRRTYVYMPQGCDYAVEWKANGEWQPTPQRPTVEMFYYSSYFRPYVSVHEPGEGELDGVYNATDTWKLINDYQDYSNVDTLQRTEEIGFHMEALKAQDDNRIVLLLRDKELRELLPKIAIPRYILVEPSESGYDRLVHELRNASMLNSLMNRGDKKDLDVQLESHQFGSTKEDYLARIVYANFYNLAVTSLSNAQIIIAAQQYWAKRYDATHDVQQSLSEVIMQNTLYRAHLQDLQNIMLFLDKACSFNRNTQALYIDLLGQGTEEHIDELCDYFNESYFVVAHYFDLGYAREPVANTKLSSGELDLLKFFSRLYDATYIKPERVSNMVCPQLLFVDEAENSYHPEWQRQFVNMLAAFTDALYKRRMQEKEDDEIVWPFQIVLTTHSPILLSDIPRMNVNYLQKNSKTGQVTVSTAQPETFGTNVFELYRHAFFMSDGLVGEYARKKIEEIQDSIQNGNAKTEDIVKRIELIGDRGIRTYLLTMLEENKKNDMLSYYKSKVEELEQQTGAANK